LIPLNDGTIFDIFTHENRKRTSLDRYTTTINAKYIFDQTEATQNAMNEVYNCLHQIMCEREELTVFFILLLAIYISGIITDKTFMIWFW